jgi:hypothetical protein
MPAVDGKIDASGHRCRACGVTVAHLAGVGFRVLSGHWIWPVVYGDAIIAFI